MSDCPSHELLRYQCTCYENRWKDQLNSDSARRGQNLIIYYLIISRITIEITLCKRSPAHQSQINTIIYYHNPWNIFLLIYQHIMWNAQALLHLFILYFNKHIIYILQLSAFDNSLQHTTALMYHHEDHNSHVTNKIYHFYLNGFLTSLSINTKDEGSVDCHKAVLVAMSEYFRVMFDVGSADVDINVLELNTTSDIVKDVLQFIYKGTTDIHDDNVELLLVQSIDMQLHQLTQQCKDFIEKNLSIDNVVRYHECSMSLQYEPLSMITSAYIKNNCTQLLSTGNLTQLRVDYLISLLAYMNIDGVEHIKLDIILQWLTVHSDCNESAELLSAIQYDELTIDCLKTIKDNPLLEQQHKLLIQESLNMKYEEQLEIQQIEIQRERQKLEKQKQDVEKQQQQQQQQQQKKQTPEGYLGMKTKNKQIKQYNVNTRKWIEILNAPDWVDIYTSWYASEHRIIIAGADCYSVNADRVAVLDMKSQGVKELPLLPAARGRPGVVVDGDEIYIIGGYDCSFTNTNTMYYTNITQNNGWTTLPTMPTKTYASVISVNSDHIYVFGGYPDYTLTQIYNKHTQQWSRGATIPARCNIDTGRCIKEGNKFTIVTRDTMMEYNSNDDSWKIVKQYKPYGGCISAVSYKGDILSCGIHKKNKISRYDADSDNVWVETEIDVRDIANRNYLFNVYI